MEIELKYTPIFELTNKAWLDGKRRVLHEGGTYSTKTFSILQFLSMLAQHTNSPLLISIVSESLPHLKRGAIRDFFRVIGESPDNNPKYNKTEHTYAFGDGVIEFFGADEADKIRGPRRDVLFINEGNNVPWETARGLDIRTARFTIVDWNPTGQFWAHDYWKGQPENVYVHSTYLDAVCGGKSVLPQEVIDNIESNKDKDPNWWNIFGLGILGKVTGLVYPSFEQVDELPKGDYFYGLDYGFSSDPSVLTKNVIIGDNLSSQEMFYSYDQLTNDDIDREMRLCGVGRSDPIYPDPDEPKSAKELRNKGWYIGETHSGKGSVKFGIKAVNSYYQHWTKDSTNCIKEQRNHRYILRREPGSGREYLSDDTTHQWSHGMDSRRYAVASYQGSGNIESATVDYM